MKMAKTPEAYFEQFPQYSPILNKLRSLLKESGLEEKMKWGMPTYCLQNKNVIGIGAFKDYAGMWFFNGVFLKDKEQVLINAQEGKTKGMRQWRFTSSEELDDAVIRKYIEEAIQNQREGKEVKAEPKTLIIPEELKEALASDSALSEAFDSMTPGKQKEYAEYIQEAKRAETKTSRLLKIKPMILEGVGLNDKYK